jgi:hypothetical protein
MLFFLNRRTVYLVMNYLSKIIYHNITPSAFYDATRGRTIASIFFWQDVVPEVGLEPTWGCPRQILSLVRIPISPLRRKFR